MSNDFQFDALIKKMADDHRPQLPSPGLIWWRAQVLKKLEAKERVERPMAIMRMVVSAVGAALLLGLVAVNWLTFHAGTQQSNLILLLAVAVAAAAAIIFATSLRTFKVRDSSFHQ
ncbi:MAG: hypothetical protein LAO20_15115 [Acidobacteriia bacterium]|nr:hypothetical protein [Terriglobia bacterium]